MRKQRIVKVQKRILAFILSVAMIVQLSITFDLTVLAAADPTALVNGGFEVPNLSETEDQWWTNYNPTEGDEAQFGWKTTTVSTPKFEFGGEWNVSGWGIQFIPEGNQFIELNPNEQSAVYQDLSTTPGDVIYWSLYQGGVWYSTSQNINNTMAVRIGTPEQLPNLTMTSGSMTGYDQSWTKRTIYEIEEKEVVTTIPEAYTNKDINKKQLYTEPKRWTQYEGVYVVPAGQTVTRFAFASLSTTPNQGNLLDGVVFRTATEEDLASLGLVAAKIAAEGVTYSAMTQAMATNEAAIKNALKLAADVAINDSSVTTTITQVSYTEPIAGTSATPAGTDGIYRFTVTVSKGGQSAITTEKTISITATAYTGISDIDAVAAAKAAIETALTNLAVSNTTTDFAVLTAAQGATLHGVAVAWDPDNLFHITNATSTATGSIMGKLKLTLGSVSQDVSVNKIISQLPSSDGGATTETPAQPTNENAVIVIVNGKSENAGTETKTTEEGRSVVTVEVNNTVIVSKIEEAIKNNLAGTDNLVQVAITDTKSEIANVELTGDIIKKLEENTFDLSIKRDNVEYLIPAEEFTISNVAKDLGIAEESLKDIKIEVKITKVDASVAAKYNEVAKANGEEILFPPVTFEIVAKTKKKDGSTTDVEISKFNNYVERILEIPAGVDPNKITTGIVFNSDGTYSHVPTEVFQKNGKWYTRLNSLTNSDYSVVWNPVTIKSVEDHWSRDAVNDMASRLVIFNSETFDPNKAITRADFAEYIVRALGIYREGSTYENKFKDLNTTSGRTQGILIANEYGIITGYPDGTFRPEQQITREEAMTMYQRAMKVTKLIGSDLNRYQIYEDFDEVSSWAESYVKDVLAAHVFNGTNGTNISPKSHLTYAEAAQAIKNLLVESNLINK